MDSLHILVDTNIVLYTLDGDKAAANWLRDKHTYCSFVTEIELKSFAGIKQTELIRIEELLKSFTIVDLFPAIKQTAIQIRRDTKLQFADALIAATAMGLEMPLISADKSFKKVTGLKLVLYEPV